MGHFGHSWAHGGAKAWSRGLFDMGRATFWWQFQCENDKKPRGFLGSLLWRNTHTTLWKVPLFAASKTIFWCFFLDAVGANPLPSPTPAPHPDGYQEQQSYMGSVCAAKRDWCLVYRDWLGEFRYDMSARYTTSRIWVPYETCVAGTHAYHTYVYI